VPAGNEHGRQSVSAHEGITIPDSPYAVQLQQGFRGLRFVRALEREFEAEFAEQHMTRMRTGFAVAMVVYAVFLLLRLRAETGPAADWGVALRGMAIAAMAMTLVASYLRRLRPVLSGFVLATYALFAIAVTAVEVVAHKYRIDRHYEGLILVSFHVYVFSGLLLRPALLAGAFIFLSYLIGGALGGLAGKEWGYQLLFIAITHLIGGVALYSLEKTERDNFLRRRLFGVLATHDSLTGLYNRMAFFQQFERTVRQAARERVAIGVVLLDIDYFKHYNDRYGHLEGDACLRAVAGAIREEFRRPLDVVARYGGEEFAGVWYDIQPQSLRALGDQLRAAVQALRIANRDAPSGRVTASVGAVACTPAEGESLLGLVKRADNALYDAKERGRNRVVSEVLPSAALPPPAGTRRAPSISGAG
jgi:diguanylate cyclase (GGDEF)-like protein